MISTALVFEVGTATITIVTQSAIKWGKGNGVGGGDDRDGRCWWRGSSGYGDGRE